MPSPNNVSTRFQWTVYKALLLSTACLAIGIALGLLLHPAGASRNNSSAASAQINPPAAQNDNAQLQAMAASQAAPLLQQLKADPINAALLTNIGNIYYDAKQYPVAINYYEQALKINPADVSVRTDLGTAYWYTGDADKAIAEFDHALADKPDNANTLFNRGLVKWEGKMDATGALADWNKLLATSPNYQSKDQVIKLMDEIKKHQSGQTGK